MLARTKKHPIKKGLVSRYDVLIRRVRGPLDEQCEEYRSVAVSAVTKIRALVSADAHDGSVLWQEAFGADMQALGGTGAAMLRVTRAERKLTQKALGQAIGMRASNVSEMERGKRAISLATAKRLAAVLQTSYKDFL